MLLLNIFMTTLSLAGCNLNLFLSTEEMKKLLGLEKELYYVRDGTINKYALGFLIPVPSYVNSLQFSWEASRPLASAPRLRYNITTTSSLAAALPSPAPSIAASGLVPDTLSTWTVALHCSGLAAGEVVVSVNIAITGLQSAHPRNVTQLHLKRKKTCHMFSAMEQEFLERGARGQQAAEEETQVPTYVVFFAGVGGCLFVLVLVLSLVIGSWLRSTKRGHGSVAGSGQHEVSKTTEYTALPPPPDTSGLFLPRQNNSSVSSGPPAAARPGPGYMTSTLLPRSAAAAAAPGEYSPAPTPASIEQLVVDRLDLTLGDLLLEGTFGRVYQGRLTLGAGCRDVMVKTIVMGSSEAQAVKLITDGSLLWPVQHAMVLPLVATTSDGSSPMMIYEYLQPGNMKRWLAGCHQPVSTHQAVSIGLQLLAALQAVHRANLVHGDVAARNCYLTAGPGGGLAVKLSDAALSKDLFPNDYHCLGDNENRPVKWMAVERIGHSPATPASDVWSWGVTVWEVLTRAQQPFPDVDPMEMEGYLVSGFRLHQPVNCPDPLYSVMVSCWSHAPHHRATTATLYQHLAEFNTQLQQFV